MVTGFARGRNRWRPQDWTVAGRGRRYHAQREPMSQGGLHRQAPTSAGAASLRPGRDEPWRPPATGSMPDCAGGWCLRMAPGGLQASERWELRPRALLRFRLRLGRRAQQLLPAGPQALRPWVPGCPFWRPSQRALPELPRQRRRLRLLPRLRAGVREPLLVRGRLRLEPGLRPKRVRGHLAHRPTASCRLVADASARAP